MKRKRKINFKQIISAVLVIATVAALAVGVVTLVKRDTKKISSFSFARGSVSTDTGLYVKGNTTLCTEDVIACAGLEITPDFDCTSSYRIFWYNMDKTFIGYSKLYSPGETCANAVPEAAWYCRIVIEPSNLDENGKVIKDFKIKFWEVNSYANDFTIKVNKDQSDSIHNIYAKAPSHKVTGTFDPLSTVNLLVKNGGSFIVDDYVVNDLGSPDTLDLISSEDFHCLFVDLSSIAKLYIENKSEVHMHLYAYDEESGTIKKSGYYSIASGETNINSVDYSTSDFAVISIHGDPGIDISVYNYMPRSVGQIG